MSIEDNDEAPGGDSDISYQFLLVSRGRIISPYRSQIHYRLKKPL